MSSHTRKSNRNRRNGTKSNVLSASYHELEPRVLLATITVNSLVDDASGAVDGLISLREAIIAANTNTAFGDASAGDADGDVILFNVPQNSVYTLTAGQITITDDVSILTGGNGFTVNGGNSTRLFFVNSSERVGFGRVNMTAGNAVHGAAITSVGSGVTVAFECNFTSNIATGLGGGAVYNETGAFYSTGSTFSGNAATGGSGSGGALLSASGVAAMLGGSMTANTANRAGGAIEVINGSLFVTNATVGGVGLSGNIAGPLGSANPGSGGGLHVTGGATVGINGSTFQGNYAAREGGGVWNQAGATMYITNNASIIDNIADGDGSDNGGGGVFNNGGDVFITNTSIARNEATGAAGSGGGIFSTAGSVIVRGSIINQNLAARAGGGIEIVNGFTGLFNTILSNNDTGVTLTASPGNGGGLHITGNADVVLQGATVTGNTAASEGGGLWNAAASRMFIRGNTEIRGNVAQGAAADNGGGGIFNNGGGVFIDSVTIAENDATGAAGSGGGIFSVAGNVNVKNSTIENNAAARAGGGIEVIDGVFSLIDTQVSNNDAGVSIAAAPGNGGGLHTSGAASVVISGGAFTGNTAANQGGGIWNQVSSNIFIRNGATLSGNSSTSAEGGAIYNQGFLSALDATFSTNAAGTNGGGIFNTDTGRARVRTSSFTANTAAQSGAGFFNQGSADIADTSFSLNVAILDGGGIFNEAGASLLTSNLTFNANLPNNTN